MTKASKKTSKEKRATLIGRKVRKGNAVRTIAGVFDKIPGGVWLDRPIGQFRSWNMDSLTLLPKGFKYGAKNAAAKKENA